MRAIVMLIIARSRTQQSLLLGKTDIVQTKPYTDSHFSIKQTNKLVRMLPPLTTATALLFLASIMTNNSANLNSSRPLSSAAEATTSSSNQKWLVVDFDGTCSIQDTTPLLPLLAARLAGDDAPAQDQRLATFDALEREFFARYRQAQDKINDASSNIDNDSSNTDNNNNNNNTSMTLEQALATLDEASDCVTVKVSKSHCLAGLDVPPSQVAEVMQEDSEIGDKTALRDDCVATLARARNDHVSPWHLGILSINWCPALIQAALVLPLLEATVSTKTTISQEGDNNNDPIRSIPIWSNQVDAQGQISLLVSGARDKRDRIAKLQQNENNNKNQINGNQEPSNFVVYVGDSATDLLALLQADVGILIGNSQSTRSMAERWGISIMPLADREQLGQQENDNTTTNNSDNKALRTTHVIWKAENWSEINHFLQTHDGNELLERQHQPEMVKPKVAQQ